MNTKYSIRKLLDNSSSIFHPSSPSGFTLIELLVVITLIGLVSGVGIFSMVNYGNTQTIEQTVGEVKSILDSAKFNAISSVIVSTNENGTNIDCTDSLSAYMVDIVPASGEIPDRIQLFMVCGEAENLIKTYSFSTNVTLGVGTTCDEVRYEAVNINATALPVLPCDIYIEGLGHEKIISLDTLGNVNIN